MEVRCVPLQAWRKGLLRFHTTLCVDFLVQDLPLSLSDTTKRRSQPSVRLLRLETSQKARCSAFVYRSIGFALESMQVAETAEAKHFSLPPS